jgi:hypothetical protein
MEPPLVSGIEKAARAYVDLKIERAECLAEEIKARNKLAALMAENEMTQYQCQKSKLLVTLQIGEAKVKVRQVAEEDGESDEG